MRAEPPAPLRVQSDTHLITMMNRGNLGDNANRGVNLSKPQQKIMKKTMADFKLRKGVAPIRQMDASDVKELQVQKAVSKIQTENERESKVVATTGKNLRPHLLMASLLEELCFLYVKDRSKAHVLFKVLCARLSELQVMAPLSHLDEMSGLRYQRRTMLYKMIRTAMQTVEQGTSLLALPDVNTPSAERLNGLSMTDDDIIGQQTSRYRNEFQELTLLGKGGFGCVYKARNYLDGREYAVKKVRFKHKNPALEFKLLREVKALANLQHTNIVGYNAAWMEYDSPYIGIPETLVSESPDGQSNSDVNPESAVMSWKDNSMSIEFRLSDDGDESDHDAHQYKAGGVGLAMNAKLFSTVQYQDTSLNISGATSFAFHQNHPAGISGSSSRIVRNENILETVQRDFSFKEVYRKSHKKLTLMEEFPTDFEVKSIKKEPKRLPFSRSISDTSTSPSAGLCLDAESLSGLNQFSGRLYHQSSVKHAQITKIETESRFEQDSLIDWNLEDSNISSSNRNTSLLSTNRRHFPSTPFISDFPGSGFSDFDSFSDKDALVSVKDKTYFPIGRVKNKSANKTRDSKVRSENGRLPKKGAKQDDDISIDEDSLSDDCKISASLGTFQNSITLYIQMELCTFTLQEWLVERNTEFLQKGCDETIMRSDNKRIFHQILQGVDFIHSSGMIHRDLKPRNIFLSGNDLHVKIGDFGLATEDVLKHQREDLVLTPSPVDKVTPLLFDDHTTGVGTSAYASPEQLKGSSYDVKSDMYSLGVMLYEMFHIFSTEMERVREIQQLRSSNKCSGSFRLKWTLEADIVESLTRPVACERPTAQEVLNSQLFLSQEQQVKHLQQTVLSLQAEMEQLRKELLEKDKLIARLQKNQMP